MTIRLLTIISLFTPSILVGQSNSNQSLAKLTDDAYTVLKFVIEKEGFDKKYGLNLIPEPSCNLNSKDKQYLQTLLIKPKQVDSISEVSWPDKNILTQADINNILKTKQSFKNFKWDNNRLGFDTTNKNYYYTFSVPYFNLAKDKALLMYESLCPGLCGGGRTLLLSRTKGGWEITTLEMWLH